MGPSTAQGGALVRDDVRTRDADGRSPRIVHVTDVQARGPVGSAIAVALDAVARQLSPAAATFFTIGRDGMLASSVVHGAGAGATAVGVVSTWERALAGLDPLAPSRLTSTAHAVVTFDHVPDVQDTPARRARLEAVYRSIDVVNDARMLVRVDDRLAAGVTLWRGLRAPRWTRAQLRTFASLQPFVERAYVESVAAEQRDDGAVAMLSRREREVARLLAAGATNAEIAQALHISPETAKSHTRGILARLGVATRRDVMRVLRPAGGPRPREDQDAIAHLLEALLRWARERLGAAAGGYAGLSGRGTVVADAYGRPEAAAGTGVRALHEALLTPAFLRQAMGASGLGDVAPAGDAHPHPDRLDRLARDAGCHPPLVLLLRLHGRVAGLVWVARDLRVRRDERGALAELRGMRPLIEAAGAPLLGRALARPATPAAQRQRLTPREWEVARATADGASNAQVADALGISEATVKAHLTSVLAKCGVRSRAKLIALLYSR